MNRQENRDSLYFNENPSRDQEIDAKRSIQCLPSVKDGNSQLTLDARRCCCCPEQPADAGRSPLPLDSGTPHGIHTNSGFDAISH